MRKGRWTEDSVSKSNLYLLLLQICLVVMLAVLVTSAPQVSKTPISEEALEMALNDKRYLMRQLKCALGEAPCDPVGRRLKSKLLFFIPFLISPYLFLHFSDIWLNIIL